MTAAAAQQAPQLLPLRSDLEIVDVGHDGLGEPAFIIHDPLRHRYFRLAGRFRRAIDNWTAGSPKGLSRIAQVPPEDIRDLQEFLGQARLTVTSKGGAQSLTDEHSRIKKSWGSTAVHSYLMFRVPLFNPERFLDLLLPLVRPLASKLVFFSLMLCAAAALFMASRQWDHFINTFLDFMTLQGAALYGVTLVGLKIFHELGHGFVARHYGVRVPVMGVSFMVMVPMLYTEASDAWRLPSRWQRLMIGAAGVLVELSLAAIALLLWVFLPDGPWRSAAFFVATTAWIMSLTVNLSSFMRFDGYHMLADATGIHSIGPRAFALALWKLREIFLKPNAPPPELFPQNTARALVVFALGTWIYRLSLFLGIAWLVYTSFPKAVGIPLAWIEVHVFLLSPIIRALKEWNDIGLKALFATRRSWITLACLGLAAVLFLLPLQRSVSVPAVLMPGREARIFAPEPAQVISIEAKPGQLVKTGDVLMRLAVPEIAHQQRLAQLRLESVEFQLRRLASDARDLAQSKIFKKERDKLLQELAGLRERNQRLVLVAAFEGKIVGNAQVIDSGQWVGVDKQLIHLLAENTPARLEGLIGERDSGRLKERSAAVFVPEDGWSSPIEASVAGLGLPGGEGIMLSYLAAEAGGPILMSQSQPNQTRKPLTGQIPIYLAVEGPTPNKVIRGTATVEVEPQSLTAAVFGRIITVFLRESGF